MKTEAFPAYLEEIDSAKKLFPDVEVFKGLEVDYIPGIISPGDFREKLDYTIGSIHFVDRFENVHWEIDNTSSVFQEGLTRIFRDNIREAVSRYYDLTRQMIFSHAPDILGHMDKIKINAAGRWFDESEPWYVGQVDETLRAIADAGIIVEVNTRGIYKKKSETTYPSPWILERILGLEIPIALSSDAHHPDDLTREFIPTLALLADIGFKNICVLMKGTWKKIPLNEHGPSA